jgi:hypothetical protein
MIRKIHFYAVDAVATNPSAADLRELGAEDSQISSDSSDSASHSVPTSMSETDTFKTGLWFVMQMGFGKPFALGMLQPFLMTSTVQRFRLKIATQR